MAEKFNTYNIARAFFVIIILYLLFVRVGLIFSYSVDLDGAEFGFVHYAQLLLQGNPLYGNPNEVPFLPVLFTPAYPYLLSFLILLFKYSYVNDIHDILVMGRTLSLLCMFVNAYFVYKLFQQFKLPSFYFLAGITIYLLLITGHFYACRPDALRTTIYTVFLYTVIRYCFYEGKIKYLGLSVFLALLAVYIKQDAIVQIFLLLFLLCLYLRNRKAYYLISFFAFSILISMVCCHFIFGEYFFTNILLFNFQVITEVKNSIHVLLVIFSILRISPLLILCAYGFYFAVKNIHNKTPQSFIAIVTVVCAVVTHIGMTKAGSNLNNAYDVILLVILAAAIALHKQENVITKHIKIFSGVILIYISILFVSNTLIHTYSYNGGKEEKFKEEYFATLEERKSVLGVTKNEIFFLLNAKHIIFYADAPIICGYDFYLYRMVELALNLKMKSKLLFVSSDVYDSYFTSGKVKYIVAENNERNKNNVSKYYPDYIPYKTVEHFVIYKFSE